MAERFQGAVRAHVRALARIVSAGAVFRNPAVWPVWASMANNLATMMRKDISLQFEQACYRATEAGDGPLLALPFSGSLGWRRRARLAGFL